MFRLPARQRQRMSALLAKGHDGTLTAQESHELDVLADQCEPQTLAMTRALTRFGQSSSTSSHRRSFRTCTALWHIGNGDVGHGPIGLHPAASATARC
jgi:hypothetical protein